MTAAQFVGGVLYFVKAWWRKVRQGEAQWKKQEEKTDD